MSQQVSSDTAMQALDHAKKDVLRVKRLAAEVDLSDPNRKIYLEKIQEAENDLQKAESLVEQTREKLKAASTVEPRTKESINPSSGVRRALSAVQNAQLVPRRATDGADSKKLSKADLARFTSRSTQGPLFIQMTPDNCGLRIECSGVFVAGLWFIEGLDGSMRPECALVFGTEENFNRWRTSRHRVFGILTEQATAAISYFWRLEYHAIGALQKFLGWLALHKTMFSDTSCEDNRRLAFDASRGIFLPPCIRAFDGDQRPRHPRACIPARQERSERGSQTQPHFAPSVAGTGPHNPTAT
mmetsp:Transcript_4462/g.13536  ORF Transcript_4462/g.13536 Transcript_4462/m.13536 type:complete len:300 (+) Transcript_4462:120-1019(+)